MKTLIKGLLREILLKENYEIVDKVLVHKSKMPTKEPKSIDRTELVAIQQKEPELELAHFTRSIKSRLREPLNEIYQQELTVEYFIKRIPFLKNNWHAVGYDDIVQIFTDPIDHKNVQIVNPKTNDIINFKMFRSGVNFEYSTGRVSGNDNVLHIFEVKPYLMMELNSDDPLFDIVFKRTTMMQLKNLAFHDTIELGKDDEIPNEEMGIMINYMNKTFFDFQKFLEGFGVERF